MELCDHLRAGVCGGVWGLHRHCDRRSGCLGRSQAWGSRRQLISRAWRLVVRGALAAHGDSTGPNLNPGQTPPESNSAAAAPPTPAPSKPPKSKLVITVAVIIAAPVVGLIFVDCISVLLG